MLSSRSGKTPAHYVLCALTYLNANSSRSQNSTVIAKKLKDYLSKEYDLPRKYLKDVSTALKGGVAFGSIGKKNAKYMSLDIEDGIRGYCGKRKRRSKCAKKRRRRCPKKRRSRCKRV